MIRTDTTLQINSENSHNSLVSALRIRANVLSSIKPKIVNNGQSSDDEVNINNVPHDKFLYF